jgi:hypothetical protein
MAQYLAAARNELPMRSAQNSAKALAWASNFANPGIAGLSVIANL